jgi:hypothetical protein
MILDHLPGTPAWQLLDCYVPIDSFQRSPTATQRYLDNPVFCKNAQDSLKAIVAAPAQERMLVSGKQALAFNRNNHQDIAYGTLLYAEYLERLSRDTTLSLETRMLYCDSAAIQFGLTAQHFRASARDERNERDFFVRRNRRMKKQVNSESRPLIRKHNREFLQVHRERFKGRSQVQKLRNENRRLRYESKRIGKKSISIRRPEKPEEKQEAQSEKLAQQLDKNGEALDSLAWEMSAASYYNFEYEGVLYDTLTANRKRLLMIQHYDIRSVLFFRGFGMSCYDTLVFSPKNELLKVQLTLDSIRAATRKPGRWVADSAAKARYAHAAYAKRLLRLNMGILQQMARLPAGSVDEAAAFEKSKETIIAINDSLIASNNERIRDTKRYNRSLKKMRLLHWRVKWGLKREMRQEMLRYSAYGRFFPRYFRKNMILFRRDAQLATKLKGEARRHKNQLRREIQRKERSELKRKQKEEKELKKQEQLNRGN